MGRFGYTEDGSFCDPATRAGMILFARVEGDVRHVDFAGAMEWGTRPPAVCLECGGEMVFRLGDINAHSFAHTTISDCSLSGGGESVDHFNAKYKLYLYFKELAAAGGALIVQIPCRGKRKSLFGPINFRDSGAGLIPCTEHTPKTFCRINAVRVEDAHFDRRVIFDIGIESTRGNMIAAEIHRSHRVDARKIEFLAEQNIPWIEFDARYINDEWNPLLPAAASAGLNIPRAVRSSHYTDFFCDDCQRQNFMASSRLAWKSRHATQLLEQGEEDEDDDDDLVETLREKMAARFGPDGDEVGVRHGREPGFRLYVPKPKTSIFDPDKISRAGGAADEVFGFLYSLDKQQEHGRFSEYGEEEDEDYYEYRAGYSEDDDQEENEICQSNQDHAEYDLYDDDDYYATVEELADEAAAASAASAAAAVVEELVQPFIIPPPPTLAPSVPCEIPAFAATAESTHLISRTFDSARFSRAPEPPPPLLPLWQAAAAQSALIAAEHQPQARAQQENRVTALSSPAPGSPQVSARIKEIKARLDMMSGRRKLPGQN